MESVWDYIMRRKPVFLGYFALFLVSVMTSFGLLSSLLPDKAISEPNIVQEKPQYYDLVLSPQAVASLPYEPATNEISISEPTQPDLIHIELTNPEEPANPEEHPPVSVSDESQQLADADQIAEVPLTNAPRKVSILRTILAVLLAVTALTLAGFGLYQAYEYFRPTLEQYLCDKS